MPALRLRRAVLAVCVAAVPMPLLGQLPEQQRLARRDQLIAADRAAADSVLAHGLARGLVGVAAPELVLVYPGAPVIVGRDPAARVLELQHALGGLTLRWVPLYAEVSKDGTFGISYGVTGIADQAATPPLRFGKYLAAWRWTADGWRLVAHAQVGLLPGSAFAAPADFHPMLPPLPTRGAVADLARADLAFAALAGDRGAPDAFAAYAAADAVSFPGSGELARGPAAIRRWLEGVGEATWKWRPVAGGAADSGDLGFTVGESEITAPGDSPSYGKYLTLWRREADGNIRFVADGGNARPAPAGR